MGLIKCKDCGAEISEDCTTCPNCGADISKQQNPNLPKQKGCVAVIILTFTLVSAISSIPLYDGIPGEVEGKVIMIILAIISAIGILIGIIKMLK